MTRANTAAKMLKLAVFTDFWTLPVPALTMFLAINVGLDSEELGMAIFQKDLEAEEPKVGASVSSSKILDTSDGASIDINSTK